MKKTLTVSVLMIFLFLSTFCSDNSTEPGNLSIEGNWINKKFVDIHENQDEEDYYSESIYNPEFDNFYSARILVITSDEISLYLNSPGTEYNVVVELEYKKNQDRLTLIDPSTNNTSTQYCYFEDEFLVLENRGEDEGYKWSEKGYYQIYNDSFPPASWTMQLQNDSYEPDDSLGMATPLTVNSIAQNHVITLGDQDWFKFNALTDSTYLIECTKYFDIHLAVYDSELNRHYSNYGESIYRDLAGEIFIKITGSEDYGEGYYSISVSTPSP